MKNKTKLAVGILGIAVTSTAMYGLNDRLSSRYQKNDFDSKTQVSQQNDNTAYDRAQPDFAGKPVRMDISSKTEVEPSSNRYQPQPRAVQPQPRQFQQQTVRTQQAQFTPVSTTQRYTVAPENKAKAFPTYAKAGECYGELVHPAKFKTVEERVMTQADHTTMRVIPAQYEWKEQRVMVRDAEERLEIVPATYKTVQERILVEPAQTVSEYIPATFRTEERRILVQPASQEWVDGSASVKNEIETNMTGDVLCLIEIPAKYETVSVQVVDRPARTEKRQVPAKYETVERTVVDVPAHTKRVKIPAEFAMKRVRTLAQPERIERQAVEPQFATVQRLVEEQPAFSKWERVFCQESIEPALAFEIERRLKDAGFDPGVVDGKMDAATQNAIDEYQMSKGMAKGAITPRTLKSLGIVDFNNASSMAFSSL